MKLIRWLLSNIILIAFVLALTYAYVYWDNLTGEDTPAGKVIAYLSVEYDEVREYLDSYDFGDGEATVIARPEPVAEATQTASVPQMMPPPRPQVRPPAQQPAPVRAIPQQPPASQQASRPQTTTTAPMQQPPASQQASRPQAPPKAMMPQTPASQQASRPQAPPMAMMQEPPARQPMSQPVMPKREPIPAGPTSASATATAAATGTGKPAPSTRELWISAREEYQRGNIEGSISNYQQVIANTNDNYDAYGELGNVYLSRGKYREAASAYFEAASILVKQGKTARARTLLPILDRLDRSKADGLNQLIRSSNS